MGMDNYYASRPKRRPTAKRYYIIEDDNGPGEEYFEGSLKELKNHIVGHMERGYLSKGDKVYITEVLQKKSEFICECDIKTEGIFQSKENCRIIPESNK